MYVRMAFGMAATFLLAGAPVGHAQDSDVQFTLDDVDGVGYYITSSSENIGPTGSSNLDPTLQLKLGKRYKTTYEDPAFVHPFQLIAFDPGVNDIVVLSQGNTVGSFESDSQVNWINPSTQNNDMYWTATGALVDAMKSGGRVPGYRCEVHATEMRGNITFAAADSPLQWPAGTETFEFVPSGTSIHQGVSGWSVIDSTNPALYSAEVLTSPAGQTNQAAGSTRWLTVTDTDDSNDLLGRVYSNTITAPNDITVREYTFGLRAYVQSVSAGASALLIVQHMDGSNTFRNVGGIELTAAGANAIIQGAADGHAGKAGSTSRGALYNYGDTGGFAQNSWVPLEFEMNFASNQLVARATGTDGTTQKSVVLGDLSLQGTTQRGIFRFCIRNHSTGNTSVISYDNLSFAGEAVSASVSDWTHYE